MGTCGSPVSWGRGLIAMAVVASAQNVPTARDQVARPGGKLPGLPPLALVKVADGFNDPINVAAANDGTGRIFVVERVGRVKIVARTATSCRSRSSI